jgi:hypothetical protein
MSETWQHIDLIPIAKLDAITLVSLAEALHLDAIAVYSKQATGEKYLMNPNKGVE